MPGRPFLKSHGLATQPFQEFECTRQQGTETTYKESESVQWNLYCARACHPVLRNYESVVRATALK